MALTFNVQEIFSIPGTQNTIFGTVDITLDDSYPDNGWPVAPSDLGVETILYLGVPATSAGGVVFGFNAATSKIVGFEADYDDTADNPLVAYATADDDCDGDIIRCFFVGV